MHSIDFYFPEGLLGFGILKLPSLVNLTYVSYSMGDGGETDVSASITDVRCCPASTISPSSTNKGIETDEFSFKIHTSSLKHPEYKFCNCGTFLRGPELLETITTDTTEEIFEALPTIQVLNLDVELDSLDELTYQIKDSAEHSVRRTICSSSFDKLTPSFVCRAPSRPSPTLYTACLKLSYSKNAGAPSSLAALRFTTNLISTRWSRTCAFSSWAR